MVWLLGYLLYVHEECFHISFQDIFLLVIQAVVKLNDFLLPDGQLRTVRVFGKEIGERDSKSVTELLKCRDRWNIGTVDHIVQRGIGDVRLLCQTVITPVTFSAQILNVLNNICISHSSPHP